MRDNREKLKSVPHKPGVYLFKDASGTVIYVGKARDLHNRLGQYFQKDFDGRPQIPFLMHDAAGFEHIIADNEFESLVLENNLIKKHMPRYNIKLRDDKNYAFIKVDYETEIPQIYTIRNPDSKRAHYYGPYSSALKIRETLHVLRKIFPFCANKEVSARPCFYYYLHRCPGVCIGLVPLDEYRATMKKIELFLAGDISHIRTELKNQMRAAAAGRQYEKAANIRDQLHSIEVIQERQKAIFAQKVNWDFISHFQTVDKTSVNVFAIRGGRLIDRKNFILENTESKSGGEIISAFLETYYLESDDLPQRVFVQEQPSDRGGIEALFDRKISDAIGDTKKRAKTKLELPMRGRKRQLIKLGKENAKEFFEHWAMDQASELSKTTFALDELAKVLGLTQTPYRLECFDISNIQGTNSVASMVVFEGGKPKKSDYRKFKIKIDGQPDDFAMMREALSRRFSKAHAPEAESGGWPMPDLLVIDGGKGQLGVAVKVLRACGLTIPVIGLAKREEEIFVPQHPEPILLPKSNYALQLLQRLRDEAHRFAITFHRTLRSKKSYGSALDSVRGIGPKKKKLLIKKFGSVHAIKKASPEELAEILGEKLTHELLQKI